MSTLGPDETKDLLPQTVQRLQQKTASLDHICEGIANVLDVIDAPIDEAIGGTATVLLRLVMIPDERQHFARKVQSLRGIVEALTAYCNAPDHAAGCDAIVTASEAANRAVFERIDLDIATTTAPRN